MPLKNDEICVIISHIMGSNMVYVQLFKHMGQFEKFQFTELQNAEGLKKIERIPGMIIFMFEIHRQFFQKNVLLYLARNEYVLARYSGDRLLYRARIISTNQLKMNVSKNPLFLLKGLCQIWKYIY